MESANLFEMNTANVSINWQWLSESTNIAWYNTVKSALFGSNSLKVSLLFGMDSRKVSIIWQ